MTFESPIDPGRAVAIEARGLGKEYRTGFLRKKSVALRDATFAVPAGKIVALLGANGSGKTTLLKIITGLIAPSGGSFRVLGSVLNNAVKGRMGFLPDKAHHYSFLTARETLSFTADLFGFEASRKKERIEEVLALMQMDSKKDIALRCFSKGMLQRVALAQALFNDPDLLLLDEPIGGLDPWGMRLMREIFEARKKAGKTVLFSSHLLKDAQEICEDFIILDRGRIVQRGSVSSLPPGQTLEHIFLSAVGQGG